MSCADLAKDLRVKSTALVILTAACCAYAFANESDAAQNCGTPIRPNILFLFADDQRADTIGAWGNEHIRTPHLDALARRGLSFRRNYCFGSRHGAVCVPSRAMLMSGRQLFAVDDKISDCVTFPALLGQNGYTTFASGKWHNGEDSWLRSFQRGRSVMFGGMSNHREVPIRDSGEDGELTEKRQDEQHSSELFADAAVEFLNGYADEQPFLCYIAFTAPHDPRDAPQRFRDHYYKCRPPLPANFLPQHPFDNGQLVLRDENLAAWPRTQEVISDQLAEYYALIEHLDEQVGRVLKALATSPHADNTLIIYAADHGLAVGSHGLLGKQSLYEHSMRCPLIIAGPGVAEGRSTVSFTYLFDLYPTICDLVGIETPKEVFGKSLMPLMLDPAARVRESIFLAYKDLMRSVRTERWKLIMYPQVNHVQLFDLENDPHETSNLAADVDQASRIDELTRLIGQWQKKVGDSQKLSSESPAPLRRDLTGLEREADRWQPDWIVEKYFDASPANAAEVNER